MPNKHIEEYLEYYIQLPNTPGFAVMLNGEWGSGKTWFINDYIDKLKDDNNSFLRISLYGVSALSDIDAQLFQQLHPFLSSKPMMLTGKFLKGAVKFGLKVDIDGDGSSDGAINLSAIDSKFSAENIDKYILIVDDLERSKLDQSLTMGYINAFVEQQGMKAIIISNESRIEDETYRLIKEKTIGITFQVNHDIESIFDTFIEKVSHNGVKAILKANKNIVIDVYNRAGYKNLRHLAQTILGFEYFGIQLQKRFLDAPDLIRELLRQYCIFSIEVKKDNDLVKYIDNFSEAYWERAYSRNSENKENEEKNPVLKVMDKYIHDDFLLDGLWSNIFAKGLIETDLIATSLDSSKYLVSQSSPAWKRLWHYRDLKDEEFAKVLDEVLQEFRNEKYEVPGEIMHVCSMQLSFSVKKLLPSSTQEIISQCKKYIAKKVQQNLYDQSHLNFFTIYDLSGWDGLGLHLEKSNEVKSIKRFFKEKIETQMHVLMQEDAKKLTAYILDDDIDSLRKMLIVNENNHYAYNDQPIFKYVETVAFGEAWIELKNKSKMQYAGLLKYRYEHATHNSLYDEVTFLKQLNRIFKSEAKKRIGKVSGSILSDIRDYLFKDAIKNLEQAKPDG